MHGTQKIHDLKHSLVKTMKFHRLGEIFLMILTYLTVTVHECNCFEKYRKYRNQ